MTKKHALKPPVHPPQLLLYPANPAWASIQHHIVTVCNRIKKNCVPIYRHHVVLRSLEPDLSRLSSANGGNTGNVLLFHIIHSSLMFLASHLCDTKGCVSDKHLVLESFVTNDSRARYDGIMILIRLATPTSPARIVKSQPCEHGKKYSKDNGDDFEYSCRKIRVIIMSAKSLNFFNKNNLK
jgi:hypothetical protein